MDDLTTWLLVQLDADEQGALAASGHDDERPGEFAERWQWVHTGDPNPAYRAGHALVDQPVDMERWKGEVHVGGNGPDYADRVSLRSVEEYPTVSAGPLPHFVIHQAEELEVAVARHITSFDPARVLREVEAKRRTIEWCVEVIGDRDLSRYGEFGLLKDDPDALAVTLAVEQLKITGLPFSDRPGYREEWKP